jgi:hypothetical protein
MFVLFLSNILICLTLVTNLCLNMMLFKKINYMIYVAYINICSYVKVKVKQSLYTPWRRLGGEEV